MDDRLDALRDEIDKIMSNGPIGRWTNAPTTFPMTQEIFLFNADGSGFWTSWSGMMGMRRQAFEWTMEFPGRLVIRYGKCEHDDDAEESDEDIFCSTSEIFDIEIKIRRTEFGPWPVMTSRSSDVFGTVWCALARNEPSLVLPRRPPVVRPKRTLISRLGEVVFRYI